MKERLRGILSLAVKILIAGGLIAWLVASGRLDMSVIAERPFGRLHIAGLLLITASMLMQCLRWWWLVRALGIRLEFVRAVQLSWIGIFFSLMLPGATSGELIRGYYIMKHASHARTAGASTVVMDRAVGLYALLLLGVIAFGALVLSGREIAPEVFRMGGAAAALLAGITLFFLLMIHPAFRGLVARLLPSRIAEPIAATLGAYHASARQVAVSLVISLGVSGFTFGSFLAAAGILGIDMPWHYAFIAGPLVIMANCLPVSPGGIGVGETAASVLFGYFGIENGASLMLLLRIMLILVALPGGLLYVAYGRNLRRAAQAEENREVRQ